MHYYPHNCGPMYTMNRKIMYFALRVKVQPSKYICHCYQRFSIRTLIPMKGLKACCSSRYGKSHTTNKTYLSEWCYLLVELVHLLIVDIMFKAIYFRSWILKLSRNHVLQFHSLINCNCSLIFLKIFISRTCSSPSSWIWKRCHIQMLSLQTQIAQVAKII